MTSPRRYLCLGLGRRVDSEGQEDLDSNPSTSLIKGTIFKEKKIGKISRQRLISIRWHFVWGKGTRFKEIFWGTKPENRAIQCIPIHLLIGTGPRAPMMRECIPILF